MYLTPNQVQGSNRVHGRFIEPIRFKGSRAYIEARTLNLNQ